MSRFLLAGLIIISLFSFCKTNPKPKAVEAEPMNIIWTKDVPAKHDIINGHAVTYEDKIYVLAGVEGRLMRYDPVTYTWIDLAGLPAPRKEAAMTLWNDALVVAGGIDDSMNFMRRVDYYDLKAQVWKSMPSLPQARSRFSLSVQGGKLYANGGVCGRNEQFYTTCLEIHEYDDMTKKWVLQTKLSSGRHGHASVTRGDELYMIGGYGLSSNPATFYINHIKKEFSFKPDIPTARGNFGGVAIGDFIITFGGKTQAPNSPMEKFNTVTNTWETLRPCPFWTDRFAYTRWRDRVYLFGGSQHPLQVWKGDIEFKK